MIKKENKLQFCQYDVKYINNAPSDKWVKLTLGDTKKASVGYKVGFFLDKGTIRVNTYKLSKEKTDGAEFDDITDKYWDDFEIMYVGKQGDSKVKDVVMTAAVEAGVTVPESAWYKN